MYNYAEYKILDRFSRTRALFGDEAVQRLSAARVAVFGVGGVGGYVVEALARSGVGAIDIIDSDVVGETDINRQIIATDDTLGMYKVDAAAERIGKIAPKCVVKTFRIFYLPENAADIDFTVYDYVVDAIDTVAGKLAIVTGAKAAGVPVISSMGTANKTDPAAFRVADVYSTKVCPVARVMRRELKKRNVKELKVVYSAEEPVKAEAGEVPADGGRTRRHTPASNSFVPPVAGFVIAGEVIKDIIGYKKGEI